MKKILIILALFVSLLCPNIIKADSAYVYDEVNCFSSQEITQIENSVSAVANKYGIDVVFYFTDKSPASNITAQAAEFFDSLGLSNGVIFELNFAVSEVEIVTFGDAQKIKGYIQEGLNYAVETINSGNMVSCCLNVGNWIDSAYTHLYQSTQTETKVPISQKLFSAAIGAGIITLIVMMFLKGQLKSEGIQYGAAPYRKPHSFRIDRTGDVFLYRTVTRRKIERNDRGPDDRGHGPSVQGKTESGKQYSAGGGRKV